MATNLDRVLQGPLRLYISDAGKDQYTDIDTEPSTGTLSTDWQLLASGLQTNDGITITPQLDPQEVFISEFAAPVAIHHVASNYTIAVTLYEVTPGVIGRLTGAQVTDVSAVLNDPARVQADVVSDNAPQEHTLLLVGRSALTGDDPGMTWWFPRVVVRTLGDIPFSGTAPTALSVTFQTLPDTATGGHGVISMVN